jgi:hypothetical protein
MLLGAEGPFKEVHVRYSYCQQSQQLQCTQLYDVTSVFIGEACLLTANSFARAYAMHIQSSRCLHA